MNNTFSASRFGKYFLNELNGAKYKFGLSSLIYGLMPVVFFVFYELIYFIASGGDWGYDNSGNRIFCAFVVVVSLVMSFPSKVYGQVTDKRFGTSYILAPASVFEKWLSMVLVACVVVPLVVGVLFFGSDFLLGVIFPEAYGTPLLSGGFFADIAVVLNHSVSGFSVWFVLWLYWCVHVLSFTLGAVFFKRNKPLKTLLVLAAVGFISMMVFVVIVGDYALDGEDFITRFFGSEPADAVRGMFTFLYVCAGVQIAVLLPLLFARLRTIKH